MMQIPFMTPEFEDRFSTQAMCRFDVRRSFRVLNQLMHVQFRSIYKQNIGFIRTRIV